MSIETIGLDELSEVLHIARRNVAFKLRQLNEQHDFPAPLPTMRGLYSRQMVEDWINRPRARAPEGVIDYVAEAKRRMRKVRK